MTKVAEPAPTARPARPGGGGTTPSIVRHSDRGDGEPPFLITFYRSAIAKKWLMAITGIMLMGFVLAHMIGNLKVYLGEDHLNDYAEWLRDLRRAAVPRTFPLWSPAGRAHRRASCSTSSRPPAHPHEPQGPAREVPVDRTCVAPTSPAARCGGPA